MILVADLKSWNVLQVTDEKKICRAESFFKENHFSQWNEKNIRESDSAELSLIFLAVS